MNTLKRALSSPPALVSINYSEPLLPIILSVDGSKKGWGAVLQQSDANNNRHPVRFESGVWSKSERNWDAGKHECKALLLAIKKFRAYLYNVRFTVETDAKTLVAQLQRSASEMPGALITRWLAYLNTWDFDIVHVAGKKNVVADALSRRPEPEGWEPPSESEEDVDDLIDSAINSVALHLPNHERLLYSACSTNTLFEGHLLDETYLEESQAIARWILFRQRPEGLAGHQLTKFKKKALQFIVQDRYLFQIASGNRPLRRVIDDVDLRKQILQELHDESGHRGKEGTWRKAWARYYWKGLYEDVKNYIRTCIACQVHSDKQAKEGLHLTEPPNTPWAWVTIDVVYMPACKGKRYLVVARDYTTQWPEAKALAKNDSISVRKFIEEYIFCRWGVPLKMSCDGGPENQGLVKDLQEQLGIARVVSSAYNPQGQGLIERGHKVLVAALKKMTGNWTDNLSRALWADRVTVKRPTGETPAFLIGGKEHVLPVELSIPTWQVLPWEGVTDTASLIATRAAQFKTRDRRLEEAVDRTIRLRHANKEYFNSTKDIRHNQISQGDLVLL